MGTSWANEQKIHPLIAVLVIIHLESRFSIQTGQEQSSIVIGTGKEICFV
jgi:hypothetical protein